MTGDPMKLVKFVCVAKSHAAARSDAALTIHQGVWAFCPMGAGQTAHDWRASDGLPFTEALRFAPRHPAPVPMPTASAQPATPAVGRSKGRPR